MFFWPKRKWHDIYIYIYIYWDECHSLFSWIRNSKQDCFDDNPSLAENQLRRFDQEVRSALKVKNFGKNRFFFLNYGKFGFSSLIDFLAGAICRLKSHWTSMRWFWPKSQSQTTDKGSSTLAILVGKPGRIIFCLSPVFGGTNAKNLWSSKNS